MLCPRIATKPLSPRAADAHQRAEHPCGSNRDPTTRPRWPAPEPHCDRDPSRCSCRVRRTRLTRSRAPNACSGAATPTRLVTPDRSERRLSPLCNTRRHDSTPGGHCTPREQAKRHFTTAPNTPGERLLIRRFLVRVPANSGQVVTGVPHHRTIGPRSCPGLGSRVHDDQASQEGEEPIQPRIAVDPVRRGIALSTCIFTRLS